MAQVRTIAEINDRIQRGNAVIMTADEVVAMAQRDGPQAVARSVDIVTTATFGAMCSSGVFLNTGHSDPPIKIAQAWLNDVPAYCGLAAVDLYVGATEPSRARGTVYGGAHVIADLVARRPVRLRAFGHRTDCYPRLELETAITLDDLNQAVLYNPRNAYQNYCAATNLGQGVLRTYMGTLMPRGQNVTYSTTGQMSPLLKDPHLRTIGIGTPVLIGGAIGHVAWEGTQHFTGRTRNDAGVPVGPSASVALIGDLKKMRPEYLRAATFDGYGTTLFVGVGLAIPVLDEDLARSVSLSDDELETIILDYSVPSRDRPVVARVSYGQLRRGEIEIQGRMARTASLSSRSVARRIAAELSELIREGAFPVLEPVARLPERPALSSLSDTRGA